jgi:hypothetical protein
MGGANVAPPIEAKWFAPFWSGQGFPGCAMNIVYSVKERLRGTVMLNDADMGEKEAGSFCRMIYAGVRGIEPGNCIGDEIAELRAIQSSF